jgi:CheY-like chemotaxis protein
LLVACQSWLTQPRESKQYCGEQARQFYTGQTTTHGIPFANVSTGLDSCPAKLRYFSGIDVHKILIVDDTADARDILARLLRRHGISTLTAADGPTALSVIAAEQPDLVILDLMMPDMDGVEVLQRLRVDPRFKALPVVMFTAASDGYWFSQLTPLGLSDVMIKGAVQGDELIRRICKLLPQDEASQAQPPHKPKQTHDA